MSLGTIVDIRAILDPTREATREQALRLRELWRMQLRLLEDMHGLPHSFETKKEEPVARHARWLEGQKGEKK